MARNSIAREDILYKCIIDEIRLRIISDLQENYKLLVNINKLCCIAVYRGSQVRINFLASLTRIQRIQEVAHCPFMVNIVTLCPKLAT